MSKIISSVSDYYTKKIVQNGATPKGVDWNGPESQILRFEQICKIINNNEKFSIADLGCGYGALYSHLSNSQYEEFEYYGFDISEKMIEEALLIHPGKTNTHFIKASKPTVQTDYVVASGIFNVKMEFSEKSWKEYIFETLQDMHKQSTRGFSFNCLTSYSDSDKMRENLYYADPCDYFDYCKKNFSKNVALLHDYGLYEFTLLVRK